MARFTFDQWASEKTRREDSGPRLCDHVGCLMKATWLFEDSAAPWTTYGCDGHSPHMSEIYGASNNRSTINVRPLSAGFPESESIC